MGCCQFSRVSNNFAHDSSSLISFTGAMSKKGTALIDLYEVEGESIIDSSRFVTHKSTNDRRILRVFNKAQLDPEDHRHCTESLKLLQNARHPNIPSIYDIFDDKERYYVIEQYCRGDPLLDRIISGTDLSELKIRNIIKQVLSALQYSHSLGLLHRNLSLHQLELTGSDGSSDIHLQWFAQFPPFNLAKPCRTHPGKQREVAPETLRGIYNEKSDIWSVGILAYLLLSGQPPIGGWDRSVWLGKINKGESSLSFEGKQWAAASTSSLARKFLQNTLCVDPDKRYSATEALNDGWISGNILNENPRRELSSLLRSYRADYKLAFLMHRFFVSYLQILQDSNQVHKKVQSEVQSVRNEKDAAIRCRPSSLIS